MLTKQLETKYLDELPVELLAEVTSNLDLTGLWAFSRVCRFFQEIVYRFTDKLFCPTPNYSTDKDDRFRKPMELNTTNFNLLKYWMEKTPARRYEDDEPVALFRGVESVHFEAVFLTALPLHQLITDWNLVRNLQLVFVRRRRRMESVHLPTIDAILSRCGNLAVVKTVFLFTPTTSVVELVKNYMIPVWHIKAASYAGPVSALEELLQSLVGSNNVVSLDLSELDVSVCSMDGSRPWRDFSMEFSILVANNPLRRLHLPDICLVRRCQHVFDGVELSVNVNRPLMDVVQVEEIRAVLPLIWSISCVLQLSELDGTMSLLEKFVSQGELGRLSEVIFRLDCSSSEINQVERGRICTLLKGDFLKANGIDVRLAEIKSTYDDYPCCYSRFLIKKSTNKPSKYDAGFKLQYLSEEFIADDAFTCDEQLLEAIKGLCQFCQVTSNSSRMTSLMVEFSCSIEELCFTPVIEKPIPDLNSLKRFVGKLAPTLRSIRVVSVGEVTSEYFDAFFEADTQLGRALPDDLRLSVDYADPSIFSLRPNDVGLGMSMLRRWSYSRWEKRCLRRHVETFPFWELLKRATSFSFHTDYSNALTCSVFVQLLAHHSKQLRYLSISVDQISFVLRKSFLKKELEQLCNSCSSSLLCVEIVSRYDLDGLDKAVSDGSFGQVRVYLRSKRYGKL